MTKNPFLFLMLFYFFNHCEATTRCASSPRPNDGRVELMKRHLLFAIILSYCVTVSNIIPEAAWLVYVCLNTYC